MAGDTSLGIFVAVYFLGGLLGGAVVGALARLTNWWLGAMIVGVAAMLPFFGTFAIYEDGLTLAALEGAVVVSVLLGAPLGLIVRYQWRKIDPFGPLE